MLCSVSGSVAVAENDANESSGLLYINDNSSLTIAGEHVSSFGPNFSASGGTNSTLIVKGENNGKTVLNVAGSLAETTLEVVGSIVNVSSGANISSKSITVGFGDLNNGPKGSTLNFQVAGTANINFAAQAALSVNSNSTVNVTLLSQIYGIAFSGGGD